MSIAIVSGSSDYVCSHFVYITIYVALVLHIIAVVYALPFFVISQLLKVHL